MPGRRAKARAFGPWADPDFVPPPPPRSKKHRRARHKKRFHHAFRVLLALGLVPTKSRQCDPLGLRLNRMHVMETEYEKIGGGCVATESASELAKPSESPGESPILVGVDVKTSQRDEHQNADDDVEGKTLVNGGCEHSNVDTAAEGDADEIEIEESEEIPEEAISPKVVEDVEELVAVEEKMDVDEEKGTKEVVNDDEGVGEDEEEAIGDEEVDELPEDNECQMVIAEDREENAEEEEEPVVQDNREIEEEHDQEPEELTVRRTSPVDDKSKVNNKETKEEPPIQQKPTIEEQTITAVEPKHELNINPINISVKTAESKTTSPSVAVPSHSKETKENVINVIPVAEPEDRSAPVFPCKSSHKEVEKRKIVTEKEVEGEVSSGSESDGSRKRIKVEPDLEIASSNEPPPTTRPDHPVQVMNTKNLVDDDRERFIQEFISQCSHSVEEMDRAADRLHKEVETLAELARAKELEWNAILRVRKIREEMLERLLRKRKLAAEDFLERTVMENSLLKNVNKYQGNNQLMMVPIVSSSPGAAVMNHNRGPPPVRLPLDYGKQQRPILPKPCVNMNTNMVDPNCNPREGRNGPILDVKSIIADYSSGYRSRHPENVPRRGRRLRGGLLPEQPPNRMSVNPSLISMANMALGSGASIRTVSEAPYNLSQDHARASSTDPTRAGHTEGSGNMGYKDVLVQFAKMTNQTSISHHGGKGPPPNGIPPVPPPPYPEVTLHPVSRPGSSPPTPPSSSLLHGILTKSSATMNPATASALAAAAAPSTRPPANFSPTLARLLTAPDRPPHPVQPPPHFRPQHPPRVSIADILSSSKKSRNEITITPVSGNPTAKPKEDVVLLQDDDETEVSDRLVIDESGDNDEVPQCQGCRQKPAQFVCAGCANQWYCSRECQVTAWEEHSDVCSG